MHLFKDTNHSFNSFNDAIEKLLDKHMPKRKITKKEFTEVQTLGYKRNTHINQKKRQTS